MIIIILRRCLWLVSAGCYVSGYILHAPYVICDEQNQAPMYFFYHVGS